MAITIRMITKLVEHLDMKLIAGENGLDREVTWTHMVDSDIISVFLQGQELVFTTGIGLNEDLSLFELVKDVYHKGASGIVINIGPFGKKNLNKPLIFSFEPLLNLFAKVHEHLQSIFPNLNLFQYQHIH